VIAPKATPSPLARGRAQVRARDAARRRVRRTRLRGYALPARIAVAVAMMLVPVMIYALLMGNLTALNYSLAAETQYKLELQEETQRLDDRIAHLESRERLSDIAARLHMHDPSIYAVVDLPGPPAAPAPTGIAFLGALFGR